MITSRRQFLQTVAAASLTAPLVPAAEPVLGMIFPPADAPVPAEATLLYPRGITFLAEGLAFQGMSIEGYEEAMPRLVPAALDPYGAGGLGSGAMGSLQPGLDCPGL